MKSLDIVKNINELYGAQSYLGTLLDFERVLDNIHLYAYQNWKKGELVSGPITERHWVTCTFMWPKSKMPDPIGAKRLLDYNIKVKFKKDLLETPVKVKDYGDFKPGTKYPKIQEVPIWLVEIKLPKTIMQEIYRGTMEVEGEVVDLEDIDSTYEQDLDITGVKDDNTEE
tara:strand:- start:11376 stop:11885 length:510 start_codon:yes stop_codon:yes gene_type:complete